MAPISPRNLSLAAVCLQSTAIAIVLHISQARTSPGQAQYKPSSAVLLTELGKLVLSCLLALRDLIKERKLLFAPRHNLPSPELYAIADEVRAKDLYSDDPYDAPPPPLNLNSAISSSASPKTVQLGHMRRRSSHNHSVSLNLGVSLDAKGSSKFPENANLHSFTWPKWTPPTPPDEKAAFALPSELNDALADPAICAKRRRMTLVQMLREDVFGGDWWKMAIPAVLFALQNNLIYVASRNLSVPVFQITFQLKTVITALAAVVMLGRRLSGRQWLALVFLGSGVATMQLGAVHAKAAATSTSLPLDSSNYVTGVSAVLVSCLSSAVAATYFELVIKKQKPETTAMPAYKLAGPPAQLKAASLWVRNIQLSLFSTVFGLVVVFVQASQPNHVHAISNLSLDLKHVVDPLGHWYDPLMHSAEGFFQGFNAMTWVVILLQTVGGLLIAVAIKHADNISKGFALAVSIVFTFVLSVIFFHFQPTFSSLVGAATVVGSTVLFEADAKSISQFVTSARRPSIGVQIIIHRRRRCGVLFVLALITVGMMMMPHKTYEAGAAVWEAVSELAESNDWPTVAIADMTPINSLLAQASSMDEGMCHWGVHPQRHSTHSAYGPWEGPQAGFPYNKFKTDQYALEDILATRFMDYPNQVPLLSTPAPDFIFLPLFSQLMSNPWDCAGVPTLEEGIQQSVNFIRTIVAAVGQSDYPRVILPITTLRSNLEEALFTPEFMEEVKDGVIVLSIENAPKDYPEGLKYLIDMPYPTGFHLHDSIAGDKSSVGDYFLRMERPNLLHYAASASHPWGLSIAEPFNGWAVRQALHKELMEFTTNRPADAHSTIIFDNIVDSFDGHQNLSMFHEHMQQAKFCPMPAGDSPSRRGFFEAIQLGCIPVIFRERSYGRLFPSSPEINNLEDYTVFVEENELIRGDSLIRRLEAIPPREVERLQRNIANVAAKMQYSVPSHWEEFHPWAPLTREAKALTEVPDIIRLGKAYNKTEAMERHTQDGINDDAFTMLLKELATIKDGKWKSGRARDLRKGFEPFGYRQPMLKKN